ncbi:MAG: adenylate/guanylate cyclase domain-containing protein [Chthoniobacterales bacterium]
MTLILLAVVCFAGLLFLEIRQPFAYARVRNLYRDAISRAGRTTPMNPDLVFLAIDSESVNLDADMDIEQLYGLDDKHPLESRALTLMTQHWPWPREVHGLILQRLVEAGAKAVMFDLTFPTPTDGDPPFRLALERYRDRAVIGSNFVDASWTNLTRVGASHTRPPDSLVPQTSPMDDRVAYTNFWPDADEVVRRAQYRVTFEQVEGREPTEDSEQFVSLGARALLKAGFANAIPPGLDEHIFRFTGSPRAAFPPHPVFEIFVPDYWKHNYRDGAFFKDKVVIVGAEGNWQHDEHQTPFGSMPGPELHLNAINAALHREFITELAPLARLGLTACAGVLAVTLSLFVRSPWVRLIVLLAIDCADGWIALTIFNQAGIFVPMVAPFTQLNLTVVLGLLSDIAGERVEKNRVRRTLERYVSHDVVRQMLDQPKAYAESLGGMLKPATILFSDIRGYSQMSSRSDPHVLVKQLNEYLTAMVECVFRFGGTLDKFIGDAVMAVWGNVTTQGAAADATAAVRAALAMQSALDRLNADWRQRGLPELKIGIAVNHGEVVVGNIGSPHRMEFTVIGDAVNVTWRMQELTKELGSNLIVSRPVADLVVEHFNLQPLGTVNIRGLSGLFEVFAVQDTIETQYPEIAEVLSAR